MKSSGFVRQTFRFITDLRFSNISFVLVIKPLLFLYNVMQRKYLFHYFFPVIDFLKLPPKIDAKFSSKISLIRTVCKTKVTTETAIYIN